MPFKRQEKCRKAGLSSQANTVGATTFKISDIKRDVDLVKTTYECGSDPNKSRIERVLSNMKRKIIKAEQIMKFGHNITGYSITQDRTRILLGRVATMKMLFKELMKDQYVMTKHDRRALCQMYHQLLSMEDDLLHFMDPVRVRSSSNCKNNEEQQFTSIRDSEVQTAIGESIPAPSRIKLISPCKSSSRNRPYAYTGIGFSRPMAEFDDSTTENTIQAMFSLDSGQYSFQSTQIVPITTREFSISPSVSANDFLVHLYNKAEETLDTPRDEYASDSEIF